MKVYLNLAFIKALESMIIQSRINNDFVENNVQIRNIINVNSLLQSLPVVIDAECNYDNHIIPELKCIKEEKLFLLKSIIKIPTTSFENLFCKDVEHKFKNNSGIYFLNNNVLKAKAEESGITFCDGVFLEKNVLFKEYSFTKRPFDGCFDNILNNVPPTNSILIIDRYIFDKPHNEKLNNLLAFVTKFKQNCTHIPFHLSIIYSDQKGTLPIMNVQNAFNKLSSLKNIEVELILLKINIPRDRVIYTNYSIIDILFEFQQCNRLRDVGSLRCGLRLPL